MPFNASVHHFAQGLKESKQMQENILVVKHVYGAKDKFLHTTKEDLAADLSDTIRAKEHGDIVELH
jgi:hypothetical protein